MLVIARPRCRQPVSLPCAASQPDRPAPTRAPPIRSRRNVAILGRHTTPSVTTLVGESGPSIVLLAPLDGLATFHTPDLSPLSFPAPPQGRELASRISTGPPKLHAFSRSPRGYRPNDSVQLAYFCHHHCAQLRPSFHLPRPEMPHRLWFRCAIPAQLCVLSSRRTVFIFRRIFSYSTRHLPGRCVALQTSSHLISVLSPVVLLSEPQAARAVAKRTLASLPAFRQSLSLPNKCAPSSPFFRQCHSLLLPPRPLPPRPNSTASQRLARRRNLVPPCTKARRALCGRKAAHRRGTRSGDQDPAPARKLVSTEPPGRVRTAGGGARRAERVQNVIDGPGAVRPAAGVSQGCVRACGPPRGVLRVWPARSEGRACEPARRRPPALPFARALLPRRARLPRVAAPCLAARIGHTCAYCALSSFCALHRRLRGL